MAGHKGIRLRILRPVVSPCPVKNFVNTQRQRVRSLDLKLGGNLLQNLLNMLRRIDYFLLLILLDYTVIF